MTGEWIDDMCKKMERNKSINRTFTESPHNIPKRNQYLHFMDKQQ